MDSNLAKSCGLLSLLTLSFVFGEMGHFLLGVTSRSMAKEIHFGDKSCVDTTISGLTQPKAGPGTNESLLHTPCSSFSTKSSCAEQENHCQWDFNGLGMEYQLLAGPAFVAVFTVAGVLIGYLGDAMARTKLLGVCVLTFSLATFCTGFATSYWQLIVLRMLLAMGESGCQPLGVSLISDLFQSRHRGTASGIFFWGIYIGFGLSFLCGVYLTEMNIFNLGWRVNYFGAGLLGLFVGLALILSSDPGRDHENATGETIPLKAGASPSLKQVLIECCNPIVLLLFLGAAFRHTAGFSFAYNNRLFYQTYYPSAKTGLWLSWIPVVGGAAGVFLGGFISDRIVAAVGIKARIWLLSTCMLIASPFAFGVLLLPPPTSFALLIPYYVFSETWLSILFTAVVVLVPEQVKTSVLGVFLFVMNNVGGNLPVLVDPISKSIGYRETLVVFFPTFVMISSFIFCISGFIARSASKST